MEPSKMPRNVFAPSITEGDEGVMVIRLNTVSNNREKYKNLD